MTEKLIQKLFLVVVEDRKLGEVYSLLKDYFIDGLW